MYINWFTLIIYNKAKNCILEVNCLLFAAHFTPFCRRLDHIPFTYRNTTALVNIDLAVVILWIITYCTYALLEGKSPAFWFGCSENMIDRRQMPPEETFSLIKSQTYLERYPLKIQLFWKSMYKKLQFELKNVPLKNLLQLQINDTISWARLFTFLYVKFAQILILKVVYNNSINGQQCYSFNIFIGTCY